MQPAFESFARFLHRLPDSSQPLGSGAKTDLIEIVKDRDARVRLNDVDHPGLAPSPDSRRERKGRRLVGEIGQSSLITQGQK